MIKLKNVSKYYNNNGVVTLGLRNINLELNKGEIVAIIGESGSGKSTLLNVICGVDSYEEGEILFKGNETSYFNQNDMDIYRKKYVSFIYQSYNVIDSYTVLENVMLPLLINGMDTASAKKRALELIDKVGLSHRIKHRGIKLSGGEKQRCVIARALASDAEILACDEPTGNLDSKTGEDIINLIKEVASDKLVLIVTHNYDQVKDIVTRTIKVSDGEIAEDNIKEASDYEVENKELELTNDSIQKRSLLKLAVQNIKSTPKKNFFMLAVLFVLSFIGLFLYLSCVMESDENLYNSYEGFKNTTHNRLVVYDEEHKALDVSKLEGISGTKIKNSYYEDFLHYIESDDMYLFLETTFSTYLPNNLNDKKGELPTKDNEVYIVLPNSNVSMYYSQLKNYLNEELIVYPDIKLKLVGYASSDELSFPLCYVKNDLSSKLLIKENIYTKGIITAGNEEYKIKYVNHMPGLEKTEIMYYGPTKLDVTSVKLYIQDLYEVNITDYTFKYQKAEYSTFEVSTPGTTNSEDVFEYTIYADDVDDAIEVIKSLGYSYYQPSKSGMNKMSFSYVLFVFYVFFSSLAMLAITFIAYVVLARVYASKNRDYTILRSLGLVKKQMARIVDFEVLILGLTASVLSVIVAYVISIFSPGYASIMAYNSIGFMLLYFVLMLLFNYFISRRFNKKLFKFTVTTSIKGEVE